MADRTPVFDLARELRARPLEVIQLAQEVGISVTRYSALLTPGQCMRIKERKEQLRTSGAGFSIAAPLRQAPELRHATCDCCRLSFMYPSHRPTPRWCTHCADHYPIGQEPSERTIARYQEHEPRLRERYEGAAAAATKNEVRMKAAFESRQKWKRALVTIVVDHEPDEELHCACGSVRWPCTTLRLLTYSNKGIAREVERLASLSPEALEAELNKHEPWLTDLDRDDDPLPAANPFLEHDTA